MSTLLVIHLLEVTTIHFGTSQTTIGQSSSSTRVAGTNVSNPGAGLTTALGIDENGALTTTVSGGGTTINTTDNVIPVRSDANTFVDSSITATSGNNRLTWLTWDNR